MKKNPANIGILQKTPVLLLFAIVLSSPCRTQIPSWGKIEQILGRKGIVQDRMVKAAFPRPDLHVSVGNIQADPALAPTSWLAFFSMGERTMMMGDFVLLESEIPSVEKALLQHDIRISALHTHLIGAQPRVMNMPVGGEGDAVNLAVGMNAVLAQTATPPAPNPQSTPQPVMDWTGVGTIMGRKGKQDGNVLQVSIPRTEKISEHGMEIPSFTGMASAINIQRIDGKSRATAGDFVPLPAEVDSVTEKLTANGFSVTAIHGQLLFESPRLLFLHFRKVGAPEVIARGLRIALGKTNSAC